MEENKKAVDDDNDDEWTEEGSLSLDGKIDDQDRGPRALGADL